jgi:hypothetical protein
VAVEIGKEVLVSGVLEVFTPDVHGDHLRARQFEDKAAVPERLLFCHLVVEFPYQTVNVNDKNIAIHWNEPPVLA